MKLYFYTMTPARPISSHLRQSIGGLLNLIAAETDTSDLVVAVSVSEGRKHNFGTAYVRQWMQPRHFFARRGKWKLPEIPPLPQDLPARFKLIRLHLNMNRSDYPLTETDIYGWQFRYADTETQAALLFAHELHHFRRYHLGFHPREGEHGANKWALNHVQQLGFRVEGKRLPQKKKKSKKPWFTKLTHDPFSAFRHYQAGDLIRINHDPAGKYIHQDAAVVRKLRSNAKRMVIRTHDGKEWRWPVQWLSHKEPEQ